MEMGEIIAMASLVVDLIVAALQLVVWVVWGALPAVWYFTAFALVFAATFGKVAVEFPKNITKIGWTGSLRIARLPGGQTVLSPALGVIIGFVVWAVVISAALIIHAYRS